MQRRVQFRLSEIARVPEASGCYVVTNITDDVIYVGETKDLHRRIQEHLSDPRMTGPTPLGLVSWFCFGLWSCADISDVETRLLFDYKAIHGQWPPLNRTGP